MARNENTSFKLKWNGRNVKNFMQDKCKVKWNGKSGSTSCKWNDMARTEDTSCKLKWKNRYGNTSSNTNEMARDENTSCRLKRNRPNGKYLM